MRNSIVFIYLYKILIGSNLVWLVFREYEKVLSPHGPWQLSYLKKTNSFGEFPHQEKKHLIHR